MNYLYRLCLISLSLAGLGTPLRKIQAECCENQLLRHQLFIGPEIYSLKRTVDGGARQTGVLYGVRGGYEYMRRYALYLGLDGLYAEGTLDGESSAKETLKSDLKDANVEGRIGYTLQSKSCYHFSLTPFIGAGYFWEENHFKHPSPLLVHFDNEFWYVPVGFLVSMYIYPQLSVGVNFKARILMDGHIKTSNDSEESSRDWYYEHKVQYRVELPVGYYNCWCKYDFAMTVIPFYEYRPYGYRANYPFDFFDTKFRLYGVNLRLSYLF